MAWVNPTSAVSAAPGQYPWENCAQGINAIDGNYSATSNSITTTFWSEYFVASRASGAFDGIQIKVITAGVGNDGTLDIDYYDGSWNSLYYGQVFDENGGWTYKAIPGGCTPNITQIRVRWGLTHGSTRQPKIARFQWNTCTPPIKRDLTTASGAGGSVTTPGEGVYEYNDADVVNIVATPSGGMRFVNWTGDTGDVADTTDPSTTITMNADYSITANFENITIGYKTGLRRMLVGMQ